MPKHRLAVVGAGQFGKNHCRVVHESVRAELCAVVDTDAVRAAESAALYQAEALTDFLELAGKVDAAVVAVPTTSHEAVAIPLLEAGIDVLVEKPIAPDMESAGRMVEAAERYGRILQVGHLERFNPAVVELERVDIVRHRLVQSIVEAYGGAESTGDSESAGEGGAV